MNSGHFRQTVIGCDYLKTKRSYSVDMLLDYLLGLTTMKEGSGTSQASLSQYEMEIQATKEILKLETASVR